MEEKSPGQSNNGQSHVEESEWETYTIPSFTRWFSWNGIHENERNALSEFFDGSSASKTPKIYKEYRDEIINEYRKSPQNRLTFTHIRKLLIGDVTALHNIFNFLDAWGLINFQASSQRPNTKYEAPHIVVDNGVPPSAVRVAFPSHSVRRGMAPSARRLVSDGPSKTMYDTSLVSHKDIFCNEKEDAPQLITTSSEAKSKFPVCIKCFMNGNYGNCHCASDNKHVSNHEKRSRVECNPWTDQEMLRLLEGTLYYGDNWTKIAEFVGTKSESECIMKLIQLPFGEEFREESIIECNIRSSSNPTIDRKIADHTYSLIDSSMQNYDDSNVEVKGIFEENKHPSENKYASKARRLTDEDDISDRAPRNCNVSSSDDTDNKSIRQAAMLPTIVGPNVVAAAAEVAIEALCHEDPSATFLFGRDGTEQTSYHQQELTVSGHGLTRKRMDPEALEVQPESRENGLDIVDEELQQDEKTTEPSHLRMRAAVATAFGAAAAHAKLLADQEEREMQYLMSVIIQNQLNKLLIKMKHFGELKMIMEKERSIVEKTKEILLAERIHILQKSLALKFSSSSNSEL